VVAWWRGMRRPGWRRSRRGSVGISEHLLWCQRPCEGQCGAHGLVMAAMQRPQVDADPGGNLGDLIGCGLECFFRFGGDNHDTGVVELAVTGDEFFFSFVHGLFGSAPW